MLWLVEGWLVTTCVAYTIYCVTHKEGKKKQRVKIMSVRNELRRIKRTDDADKKNLF